RQLARNGETHDAGTDHHSLHIRRQRLTHRCRSSLRYVSRCTVPAGAASELADVLYSPGTTQINGTSIVSSFKRLTLRVRKRLPEPIRHLLRLGKHIVPK